MLNEIFAQPMGELRNLFSCRARDHFLYPDETDLDGCNMLPRAWFPTLLKAAYSAESIDEMFTTCDANGDDGVTWTELRNCFEDDDGMMKRWMLRDLHLCYDQVYTGSTFDEKLDRTEFENMVSHQSSLWTLAHNGDECAAAFLEYDKNGDLLLQYGESQSWIMAYGDFAEGTKKGQKKTFHRNWWAGADLHDSELDDNDLTWFEFSQACPNVTTIGGPAPPTPPSTVPTIEELAEIA